MRIFFYLALFCHVFYCTINSVVIPIIGWIFYVLLCYNWRLWYGETRATATKKWWDEKLEEKNEKSVSEWLNGREERERENNNESNALKLLSSTVYFMGWILIGRSSSKVKTKTSKSKCSNITTTKVHTLDNNFENWLDQKSHIYVRIVYIALHLFIYYSIGKLGVFACVCVNVSKCLEFSIINAVFTEHKLNERIKNALENDQ